MASPSRFHKFPIVWYLIACLHQHQLYLIFHNAFGQSQHMLHWDKLSPYTKLYNHVIRVPVWMGYRPVIKALLVGVHMCCT